MILLLSLQLCGCSTTSNVAEPAESKTVPIIESVTDEMQSNQLFSFDSEVDLWAYLESTCPIVTIDSIESGNYTGSYVILDSVAQNVEVSEITNYVNCDMYFTTSSGESCSKYFACFFTKEDLQKYGCVSGQQYLSGMQSGDVLRGCYYVNKDNSFGAMNMLAITCLESGAGEISGQGEATTPSVSANVNVSVSTLLFSGESIIDITENDMENGYNYIKDVYITVDESEKLINIVVQVSPSTSIDTAKTAGEDVSRYLASMACFANSYYDAPGSDYLGGIYDTYNLLIYVDDGSEKISLYGGKVTSASQITW